MSATRKPAPSECECGHHHNSHDFNQKFPLGRCVSVIADNGSLCQCTQYHRVAESGAPLQPGATQPEDDAVLYETGRILSSCYEPQSTFTHSELTTLLERMARLVVQEIAIGYENAAGVSMDPIEAMQHAEGWREWLTPEKLQQLREAVERP